MAVIFIRTLILFILLIFSMRIMGKRQLGELELSELVVAILVSDMAANPLQDIEIPLLNGIIPLIVLLCGEIIISGFEVKSVKFRAFLCGKPSIIIKNGKIIQKEMHKNRITLDELAEELRIQNVTDISTVQTGILETDGKMSLQLYAGELPPTANDMKVQTEERGVPVIVINDGTVMEENLKFLNLNRAWLKKELADRNIKSEKSVYIMSVNRLGQIYFAVKEQL